MNDKEVISYLAKTNDPTYNLTKFLEEKAELEEVLLKNFNKNGIAGEKAVQDEIGDLEIRLKILKEIYGKKEIKERVRQKLARYRQYISEKKYIGRI